MALVVKDRVKVTFTTTGTSDFTPGGAVLGFQSFSVIGNGNDTYYTAIDPITGDFEVGIGTFTTAGPTLTRTTILESSAAGAKVSFGAGSKDLFVTYPAERAVYLDTAGSYPVQNTFNALNATTATLTNGTVSTTPASGTDIANKSYVDTVAAAGIHYHTPVFVESPNTAGNLNATYNQPGGAGVGVGATLTNAGTQVALTIDGVLMTTTKRVLIYNQTNAAQNGVYTVTTVGNGSTNWVLTRATDADTYAPSSPNSLGQGDAFFVTSGDTGAGEGYVCTTVGTITFGTTAINFSQFSASVAYNAGTGLNLNPATTFNISNVGTAGTYGSASNVPVFVTNAQGQVTSVTNTGIAIASGAVSGLAASATTDTTNAANITTGTLPSGRISGSYTGLTGTGALAAGSLATGFTAVSAPLGGTGQTSYAVGDLIYADTTTSLAKLADVAVGNALISGGVGSAPSYGKIGLATHVDGTLPVVNGGTGVTSSTGTGSVVLSSSPTLTTPALGTPSALVGTNITGTATAFTASNVTTNANLTGAVTSVGNATSLGSFTSAQLLGALSDETGTGANVFATSPTLVTPALGTPSALVGTNITGTAAGLTAGNVTTNANLTGAVTSVGNATSLGSFTSAQLLAALTDETGTGANVFATSPTLVTPLLGTPTSGNLANCTFPTLNQNTSGSAATFTSTSQNSQFNSVGVGTAGSGTAGEIRATNNITAYYSDDRFKTNLGNISDALAKVLTLNGFYYEANELAQSYGYEKKLEVGVSAQQVQAVQPEVVAPAPIDEKYLTVRYERLVPLLIEAIKELNAKVAALERATRV